jgi:hypothetical protein
LLIAVLPPRAPASQFRGRPCQDPGTTIHGTPWPGDIPRRHRLHTPKRGSLAASDLVRLEYGPWDQRPDLRASFLDGYGRALAHAEEQALPRLAALDALSGLQWGTANGDREVTGRARRTFARLRVRSP